MELEKSVHFGESQVLQTELSIIAMRQVPTSLSKENVKQFVLMFSSSVKGA